MEMMEMVEIYYSPLGESEISFGAYVIRASNDIVYVPTCFTNDLKIKSQLLFRNEFGRYKLGGTALQVVGVVWMRSDDCSDIRMKKYEREIDSFLRSDYFHTYDGNYAFEGTYEEALKWAEKLKIMPHFEYTYASKNF